MKKIIILLPIIFCVIFTSKAEQQFPEVDGWALSEETRIFDQDNLFDYINGAAELFFTYGFEKLYVKEYVKEEQMVKVEIYHHTNALNAFGMYSQERYQDGDFLLIGAQGYGGDGYLNFVKDKYYIKVVTYNTPMDILKQIASKVADKLPGKQGFPEELEILPEKGRIIASEKFIANNYLGLSFLAQVVTADYEVNGSNFSMFIIQDDPEKINELLLRYYQFVKTPQKSVKMGIHEIKDPYNGDILLKWEGNKLIGIVNLKDKKLRKEYLE